MLLNNEKEPPVKAAALTDDELEQVTGGVISPESLINIVNEQNYELNLFDLSGVMIPENNQVNVIVEQLSTDCDYPIPPIPFH